MAKTKTAKEKHPLYSSWGWIRRGGKPVDPRWQNFFLFIEDVGERPAANYSLQRKDESKPYGPDNFEWRQFRQREFSADPNGLSYGAKWHRARREENKDYYRQYELKRRYGITLGQYQQMFDDQRGLCKICGNPETTKDPKYGTRNLAVDHCHQTSKIRGLLCGKCNQGLGSFDHDLERVRKAIQYLES